MKTQVTEAVSAMERKFSLLAGESLKRPAIQISFSGGLLDGQTFDVPVNRQLQFGALFIKNTGLKKTDPLSVRMYCAAGVTVNSGIWAPVSSTDHDLPVSYYLNGISQIGVAPEETWSLDDGFNFILQGPEVTNALCKLQVFFGAEKPAEARFRLTLRK
jgi:hypothetical protein